MKEIQIVEARKANGNVSLKELMIICQTVIDVQARHIFEFGTFDGRTTINLAVNSPQDAQIYTLDIPASAIGTLKFPLGSSKGNHDSKYILKPEIGERYKKYTKASTKIIQLLGDSATFDYSPFKNLADLIFIDGSHAKDYVKNDTEAAFSMIKQDGIIFWHDYDNWPDVTAYLDHSKKHDVRFSKLRCIKGTNLAMLKVHSPNS